MTRRDLLVGSAAAASCSPDRRPRLNILNWSEYVAPETIPDFEREFHVRVRYGLYESAEEMLAKVMSGNSGWDVVFPPSNYVKPMVEMDLLAAIDHARLPGLARLDPQFASPPWDPRLAHSIPYMWGATGIVYQTSVVPPVTRWADLWGARLARRVTMLDDPVEVFGACLKKLGLSVNSADDAELRRAQAEAAAQKPLLRAYVNQEVRDQLIAGEVLAAQCWRDLSQRAAEAAPGKLAFTYPEEGFALYADNMAILRESKRVELAHQFLEYVLRPKVAAAISLATRNSTVNREALELLPPVVRANPNFYPPPETLERGEWLAAIPSAAQRLRDRLWTEIKSG
jgi:spermidine/putrescine transport system substrate-binding protein